MMFSSTFLACRRRQLPSILWWITGTYRHDRRGIKVSGFDILTVPNPIDHDDDRLLHIDATTSPSQLCGMEIEAAIGLAAESVSLMTVSSVGPVTL